MRLLELLGKPLFVSRPLLNTQAINRWAAEQGFTSTLGDDAHVTIAFSKQPVEWRQFAPQDNQLTIRGGQRHVQRLGDEGATVLRFASAALQQRWQAFCDGGASWDYDDYRPHLTISYNGHHLDLSQVTPYAGELIFGPERFKVVDEDWASKIAEVDV